MLSVRGAVMYSLVMLPLVIANTMLVVWLLRRWLATRDWVLLLTLIMMIALPYDTAVVMLGGVIGAGELLRHLNVPRITWLYLTPLGPLTVFSGDFLSMAAIGWTAIHFSGQHAAGRYTHVAAPAGESGDTASVTD